MIRTEKFQISYNELSRLTCKDNVIEAKNKKQKQLKGNFIEPFLKGINVIEGDEIQLQKRNSALHEKNRNIYLRINADCKKCPKKDGVHYVFIIKSKPDEKEKFVDVYVEIKNEHQHETKLLKRKQIRGEERDRVAEAIVIAGGPNAYVNERNAAGNEAPTKEAARKILSSVKNKNFSSDWIHSLHSTADAFEAMTIDNKLSGYIQTVITHKEFAMYSYCQEQLEVVRSVPPENRIGHFDATGNLSRIPKQKREYARMLNHMLLLKDSRNMIDILSGKTTKSSIVADLSTTRQDVYRISDFFRCLKTDYETLYSQSLSFRLIVCDYAWASMHSIVEAFNNQTMDQYCQKVWQLSLYEIETKDQTWIISCTSHTMKRYVKNLSKVVDRTIMCFCSYLFSIMLNCLDLESISLYFKLIMLCFFV